MAKCRHHEICGREALEGTGEDLCILHSHDPEKNSEAFDAAFEMHRREKGDDFSHFVFPSDTDFGQVEFEQARFYGAKFNKSANFIEARFAGITDFRHVTFNEEGVLFGGAEFGDAHFEQVSFPCCPDFTDASFAGTANFSLAKFTKGVILLRTNFAEDAHFGNATFTGRLHFAGIEFQAFADFFNATFKGRADFFGAVFSEGADFRWAKFTKGARFDRAEFTGEMAEFYLVTFSGEINFCKAVFAEGADFHATTFGKGGNFIDTKFDGNANFSGAEFLGRMFFASNDKNRPIFSGAEVDFRSIYIDPLDVLVIHDADLQKCKFQGTDLRKIEITGAKWPKVGSRDGVYDETAPLPEGETRAWHHTERLYRQLKQNYEDRKDYERASDFHYGEKEMRRKNPETSQGLRLLLTLYWLVSGYGERWVRPLIWAAGLLVVCAVLYLFLGLHPKNGGSALAWTSGWDWLESSLYSFRVMTLLKPDDLVPVRLAGKFLYAIQSIVGPIILGLFALAIRQRLKR